MPRRDDYDDYDSPDPSYGRRAPFPTGVRIAGIIWVLFGAITILSSLAGFVTQAGAGGGGSIGCGLFIPIAFLITGIQTVQGTAKGVLASAIGSIVFGLIYLAVPILLFQLINQVRGGAAGPMPPGVLQVVAGVMILAGVALLAAGGLALVNRQEYMAWRIDQGLAQGPRLTVEQQDYDDDQPRRRRRDYDDDR